MARPEAAAAAYVVKPLDASTWTDFARLVEKHNGVWGGCWCMGFHEEGAARSSSRREWKETRVREGRAHAALVFDGDDCIGWCQFGSPPELPRIKRKKVYEQGAPQPAAWRITCFFVANDHRRRGVAAAALDGALREIGRLGGGLVETFPEVADGRKVSGSFLHNGTAGMFESRGFARVRQLGKHHWLMTKVVPPSPPSPSSSRRAR